MKSERVDTWVTTIPDRPGALAGKLKQLAAAGVNLEFIIARRSTSESGKTIVFVTPVVGPEQIGAASAAGFTKSTGLHTIRIEGPDQPGQGSRVLSALADKGLNLRGVSAAAMGQKFVCHIALDTEADAVKAAQILQGFSV